MDPESVPMSPTAGDSQPESLTPTLNGGCERDPFRDAPPMPQPQRPPVWTRSLSMSFSAMADQIAAASQALALVPESAPVQGEQSPQDLRPLQERLETIVQSQERLGVEIETLKGKAILPQAEMQTRTEALEKKVDELFAAMKLDEMRLYARLHNATATVSKMPIMAPAMANGKPPPNFPATKGEFEHLTKERYEGILKSYGLPAKGDTNAKREAVRVFIGLPT
ncbi:hypothetical protein PLICRDRAFT_702107 [Plicaturopsis crispa FD-325 SS-3]|uniref:Unplaced genomic scaffold PLICRscaffold_19, whole genome shotgun sequence n=1 Tax=Plicaturopsis crispa FD-325 SS-3 TaxID=944288 RepID=A0A0C9SQY8_PLICR|nr:hypothetical protein PLICRDRAFT_702107 [Plicaturopsis crispa FD-325 SS-3]